LERICTHPKALTDTRITDNEENHETEAPIQRRSSTWWSRLVRDEDMSRMEHSAKITLLVDILRRCKMSGEKVLVFSQFLHTLNFIEEFLAGEDERNRTIPENNEVSLVSSNQ
jgi:transcriptional regulator ATRX